MRSYYICDDCCKSDTGTAFQAQAFNIIKSLDPYHAVIGASDCADNYVFSDVRSSEPPTAVLSEPVISFGQQPHTQLSLDYIMIENYGGGLTGHRNGGSWATGVGNDGRLRNGIPFEPLCNCPGEGSSWQTVTDCGDGDTVLRSEMWEGIINAGMTDQLNFIEEGDARGDAVMAGFARQLLELMPSIRASAGFPGDSGGSATITATVTVTSANGQLSPTPTDPSGALRVAVWEEPAAPPAVICAHLAIVNSNTSAYLGFELVLGGGHRPPTGALLTARRIFSAGATLNVSTAAGAWRVATDFIAPGETNLYRIGCEAAAADPQNLATNPTLEGTPALARQPGWAQAGYGHGQPLAAMTSDTTVAKTGRHSVKINVPDGTALVFPLAGKQLVKPPPGAGWGAKKPPPIGTHIPGASVVLSPGKTYHVSLSVQTSPPGTTVEIMAGYWVVTGGKINEASPALRGDYNGSSLAAVHGGKFDGDGLAAWQTLQATVRVPAATASQNGTALQLRITPRPAVAGQRRAFGATVWVDAVVIKESIA